MIELQDCLGRIFTRSQLPLGLQQQAQTLSGMIEKKGKLWCNRCGQVVHKRKTATTNRCLLLQAMRAIRKGQK